MLQPHRDVPWCGNRDEQQCRQREIRESQIERAALYQHNRQEYESRNDEREWSFHQEAKRRGCGRQQEPAPWISFALERRDKSCPYGQRDEEGQWQVGKRHARQSEVAEVRSSDGARQQTDAFIEPSPSH